MELVNNAQLLNQLHTIFYGVRLESRATIGGYKMHIFTANIPTFLSSIEDRCLLLTSSTSFVDLPFQEHRVI
jgi:hypothetical protein